MTPDRHGSAVITFPNELEVVITREFDAPIALVFDVLTKPEHVSKWGATPPDRMTECSIDLRVGGQLPLLLRDRRRNRVLVQRDLPGGRAAGPNRGDVALQRVGRMQRRSRPWSCTNVTESRRSPGDWRSATRPDVTT